MVIIPICAVQAYLGDTAGSVPDHRNTANITIKRDTQILGLTQIWGLPSARKSYVYTIL